MRRITRFSVLAVVLTATLNPAMAWAQVTELVLNSQPGDYIGGGISRTLTPADGVFTPSHTTINVVSFNFNGGADNSWTLNFAAPANIPLTVGVYENATRYPFQSPTLPGLSIYGDGRGCNTSTGRFEVLEAVYGPGGQVQRFTATFEQHCEGFVPALLGSIEFDSTLPPPPPPLQCTSRVATITDLLTEVAALPTSKATLTSLGEVLLAADWLVSNHSGALARYAMTVFTARAVLASDLPPTSPDSVSVSTANSLACGASNVLMNIYVP